MLAVVVDDKAFSSNCSRMMKKFKSKLPATCPVELLGQLRSFVGWTISINEKSIEIDEGNYAKSLLEEHGIAESNAVDMPLPQNRMLDPREMTKSHLDLKIILNIDQL